MKDQKEREKQNLTQNLLLRSSSTLQRKQTQKGPEEKESYCETEEARGGGGRGKTLEAEK